jgi:hypothetical protein
MRLLAIGAVLLLTGCAASTPHEAAPQLAPSKVVSPVPSDPAAAIAAAKAQLGKESVHFSATTSVGIYKYTGVFDVRSGSWDVTGTDAEVRRIGDDVYAKVSDAKRLQVLPLDPPVAARLTAGGWAHSRLPDRPDATVVFNDAFPWDLAAPVLLATKWTRTGDRSFAGTWVSKKITSRVGVDLDEQNHFAKITLTEAGSAAEPYQTCTFSEYGVPADISAPPRADVIEESDSLFLTMLGLP